MPGNTPRLPEGVVRYHMSARVVIHICLADGKGVAGAETNVLSQELPLMDAVFGSRRFPRLFFAAPLVLVSTLSCVVVCKYNILPSYCLGRVCVCVCVSFKHDKS